MAICMLVKDFEYYIQNFGDKQNHKKESKKNEKKQGGFFNFRV